MNDKIGIPPKEPKKKYKTWIENEARTNKETVSRRTKEEKIHKVLMR